VLRRPATVVAACALAALVSLGCSKKERAAPGPAPAAPAPGSVVLELTGVEANGTPPLGADVVAAVKTALDRYVADAIVAPLRSGGPAPDLTHVLTPAALARLGGPDRETLVQEGLPAASGGIRPEAATVALSTLAGPDGGPVLVAARLDLRLHAVGPGLDVDVVRQGDLVLVPEGDQWRIDGYQLRASRDSRGAG
jgi:hypothetical protein